MVRVWIRPMAMLSNAGRVQAAAAVRRAALHTTNVPAIVAKASSTKEQQLLSISKAHFSKKAGKDDDKKKTIHDRVEPYEEDMLELSPEVEYLSQEAFPDTLEEDGEISEVEEEVLEALTSDSSDSDSDEDAVFDEEDFEAEFAKWEEELSTDGVDAPRRAESVEDDRLYIEMPGYDASLGMASDESANENGNIPDPFSNIDGGMGVTPEMLNWMRPKDQREPMRPTKGKPGKYYARSTHSDVVELAMDVELLRLFLGPTGRIKPRRFTGLSAKEQREVTRAIKISRQMALLPYLSRYPEPTPTQWRAIMDEEIARTEAEIAANDGVEEEDDFDMDDDFDYE